MCVSLFVCFCCWFFFIIVCLFSFVLNSSYMRQYTLHSPCKPPNQPPPLSLSLSLSLSQSSKKIPPQKYSPAIIIVVAHSPFPPPGFFLVGGGGVVVVFGWVGVGPPNHQCSSTLSFSPQLFFFINKYV
jgi:hypothetical protein